MRQPRSCSTRNLARSNSIGSFVVRTVSTTSLQSCRSLAVGAASVPSFGPATGDILTLPSSSRATGGNIGIIMVGRKPTVKALEQQTRNGNPRNAARRSAVSARRHAPGLPRRIQSSSKDAPGWWRSTEPMEDGRWHDHRARLSAQYRRGVRRLWPKASWRLRPLGRAAGRAPGSAALRGAVK